MSEAKPSVTASNDEVLEPSASTAPQPAASRPNLLSPDYYAARLPLWIDLLLVLAIVAFTAWSNLNWAATDKGPPPSDGATHAYHSMIFHDTCRGVATLGQSVYQFLTFRNHYPPLSYQVGELGYAIVGTNEEAYIVGMIPFTLILGFSMYFLCRNMSGRLAGITGAILACSAPSILEYSRLPFIDMQVAAITAFSLFAVFACDGFRHRGYSLLCGLAVGLGMLAKWTFPVFIIAPLLYAFILAVVRSVASKKEKWLRSGATLVIVVAASWIVFGCFMPDYTTPYEGPGFAPVLTWLITILSAYLLIYVIHRREPERSPLVNALEALLLAVAVIGPWYGNNRLQITYKAIYQAGVHVDFLANVVRNCQMQITWLFMSTIWVPLGLALGLLRRESRAATIQLVICWVLTVASLSAAPSDARYLLPTVVFLVAIGMGFMPYARICGILVLGAFAVIGAMQCNYYNLNHNYHWILLEEARNAIPYRVSRVPAIPMAPRTEEYPFAKVLAAMEWSKNVSWTGLLAAAPQVEATIVQPRCLLYYAALEGKRMRVREVLSPEQSKTSLYNEGQATNYMLMYRDPAATHSTQKRVFIPDDPVTRQEVLERTRDIVDFPKVIKSKATFRFGADTLVELVVPVAGAPANAAFEKARDTIERPRPRVGHPGGNQE